MIPKVEWENEVREARAATHLVGVVSVVAIIAVFSGIVFVSHRMVISMHDPRWFALIPCFVGIFACVMAWAERHVPTAILGGALFLGSILLAGVL